MQEDRQQNTSCIFTSKLRQASCMREHGYFTNKCQYYHNGQQSEFAKTIPCVDPSGAKNALVTGVL